MWNLVPEPGEVADPLGQAARGAGRVDPRPGRRRQGRSSSPGARQHADRPAGAVRLQPVEREPARHDALPPGLQHDVRVHQPALHLLLARVPLHDRRRDQRLRALRPAALDRRRPPRPRPPDGHRRARAAGAVDAGRRAGLHLPEHQPRPCRRWAWAAGPTPATSPASSSAAWTCPGWASASPRPSAARRAGRARRRLRGLHPALPRRHGRGGGRLPGGQVVAVRADKPKPYLEPDRVVSADRPARRGHDRDRQGLLPVRPRDLRALPGLPRPDVPAPHLPGPARGHRTSTRATTRRARSPSSTWPTSSAGTPSWRATTAVRRCGG